MRLENKTADGMGSLVRAYVSLMKLGPALNTRRVFIAWDKISGATDYTLRRYYRDGVLYITMSSSALRALMNFRKQELVRKLNEELEKDELFIADDPTVGFVKELILK